MPGALATDFYELTMAASYLRRGLDAPATFSLFVRALPPQRGFLVAAGLEDCLAKLAGFGFDAEDLAFLAADGRFTAADLERFAALRFTGDVRAIPEGRIVLAGEPLLEVTAPLAEAQLVETLLLNQVTFQTAVASKAARCRLAARGRQLVEFGLRRTHGVEAGVAVARCCAIAGFDATSNVEAARRHGIPASGTMAHSYVQAFPGEPEAFAAFAADFPGGATFLVDTYDTAGGVRAAIEVIEAMGLGEGVAVRLDSGDLLELATTARTLLDAANLGWVTIIASGNLDELAVDRLIRAGAPIDAFGIGTRLGVSADAPFLDTVYKLVEVGGQPVLKLSPGKATAPGPKQVFRSPTFAGDVVGLADEAVAGLEPLLVPVMTGGRRLHPPEPLAAARGRLDAELSRLPAAARRLEGPVAPSVAWSPRLQALAARRATELRPGGDER